MSWHLARLAQASVNQIFGPKLAPRFTGRLFQGICCQEGERMSFGLYIVGFLIMIGGLIYGATILHVSPQWIAVGTIILIGLAILKGVQATRGRDPS